jgi:hypothetical protein
MMLERVIEDERMASTAEPLGEAVAAGETTLGEISLWESGGEVRDYQMLLVGDLGVEGGGRRTYNAHFDGFTLDYTHFSLRP